MRVVGVVPARAGSKGVPGKNLRPLAGRPLLAHTAETALASSRLERVVLSTEDPHIAEVGAGLGLEVPGLRPRSLARDDTPMIDVLRHVLGLLDPGVDALCLLQPTCPFRRPGLVDDCVERLERTGADAVVTMAPVPAEHHPCWTWLEDEDGVFRLSTGGYTPIGRRQDLPPAYHRDGAVYVFRSPLVMAGTPYGGRLEPVVQDPAGTVNIDTPDDWAHAESIARGAR